MYLTPHRHPHPHPFPLPQEAAKAAIMEDVAAEEATKSRASQLMADAEVAAAEKLLKAAQIEYDLAEGEKSRLSSAAFSDADRAESGKAAAVAVAGGLLAALPLALAGTGGAGGTSELLALADTTVCCALFGVTYRLDGLLFWGWSGPFGWVFGCVGFELGGQLQSSDGTERWTTMMMFGWWRWHSGRRLQKSVFQRAVGVCVAWALALLMYGLWRALALLLRRWPGQLACALI